MDDSNLFPANSQVNAELDLSFVSFSECGSTCKHGGHEITDLPSVFIQGKCKARQIDFSHVRKFHKKILPPRLTREFDLPRFVVAVAQITHPAKQIAEMNERDERSSAIRISDLMVEFDGVANFRRNFPCLGEDAARGAVPKFER